MHVVCHFTDARQGYGELLTVDFGERLESFRDDHLPIRKRPGQLARRHRFIADLKFELASLFDLDFRFFDSRVFRR